MTGPDFEGDNKNLDNKTSIEENSKPNRVPLEQNKNLPIIKPEDKPLLTKDPQEEDPHT